MQGDGWKWWRFRYNQYIHQVDEQLIKRMEDKIDEQRKQLEALKYVDDAFQMVLKTIDSHNKRVCCICRSGEAWLIVALEVKYHVSEVHRLVFELFNANQGLPSRPHKANSKLEAEQECNRIYITDIVGEDMNCGYGSILMSELITYAQLNKIPKIVGNMERRDLEDHGERLLHFYRKFGFDIIDLNYGRKHIELKLHK